ncbi:hypothetical protein Y1Q_0009979 [Alligator mississippiensis]|uniref:Uncharacterized protein n=1 Tax=Alligator mississippiensis TaxID=8496 RepID=A0A151N0K1_ALLMI|nr:hypothetical protein Y1Q_0009979 [Alligator mississippiensis]
MRTTACLILCLLGCLVLSPWLEGAETKACANGWLHYGHKCYGFFKNKKSWAEAEHGPGADMGSPWEMGPKLGWSEAT